MAEYLGRGCSVPDTDLVKLEDVKSALEKEVMKKMNLLKDKYEKIQSSAPEIYSSNWLKEVENTLSLYLLEKTEEMDSTFTDSNQKYLNLYKALTEMNKQKNETLQYLVKEEAKQRNQLRSMQKTLKHLNIDKLMEQDSEDEQEDQYDFNIINKKTTSLFASAKKDLQFVIRNYYNEDMENLLMNLTNAYFDNSDEKYISIDDYDIPNIAILDNAGLISYHPTEKNKIKFDKFT